MPISYPWSKYNQQERITRNQTFPIPLIPHPYYSIFMKK